MKSILRNSAFAFACALVSFASANAQWPKACGTDAAQYKVKSVGGHSLPAVDPGKAQVVFLERLVESPVPGIVRFGMDGSWLAATKGGYYTVVDVTPGTHHLCSIRQSGIRIDKDFSGEATVNLEAGKTYYFEFTITHKIIGWAKRADGGAGGAGGTGGMVGNNPNFTLKDGDSVDEGSFGSLSAQDGQARIQRFSMSTSTPK